ncbi:hypothetical protein ASD64_18945 [Mesorhizobium sp. Root157]|nr:hypothetical protein ASD64_18945 [Mesorhizobium sp. Root157]
MLHPDRSEAIIDAYWRADGEQPGKYTIELATLFLDLARSETKLDDEGCRRAICSFVRVAEVLARSISSRPSR